MTSACIVRARIPADEFVLYEALSSLPDIEFEVERIVQSGNEVVMPLLWILNAGQEAVETAINDDPSVQNLELLSAYEDKLLYRMEWTSEVRLIIQMVANSEATITDAFGSGGQWSFRILYPSRELLSDTIEYAEEEGLTIDVAAIRRMEGNPAGRFGLTEAQFEALETAHEAGYFNVPRDTDLSELADELNISHQALSERLRRGTDALIEDTLLIGKAEKQDDQR